MLISLWLDGNAGTWKLCSKATCGEGKTLGIPKSHLPEFFSLVALSATPSCMPFRYRHLPIMTVYIRGMLPSNTENIAFISGVVFSAMGIAQFLVASTREISRPYRPLERCSSTDDLCRSTWLIPQAYVTLCMYLGLSVSARFWARWYVTCAHTYLASKHLRNIWDKYSRWSGTKSRRGQRFQRLSR